MIAALGTTPFKPLAELGHDDFLAGLLKKALPQIDIVQIGTPYVADGGVVHLDHRRPGPGTTCAAGALAATLSVNRKGEAASGFSRRIWFTAPR